MDWLAPRALHQAPANEAYFVHLESPDGFGEEARSNQV